MRRAPDRLDERYRFLAMFIDGQRVQDGVQTLSALLTSEIETVQFYRGASQLPPQAVGDACAAIFIWTRYTVWETAEKQSDERYQR